MLTRRRRVTSPRGQDSQEYATGKHCEHVHLWSELIPLRWVVCNTWLQAIWTACYLCAKQLTGGKGRWERGGERIPGRLGRRQWCHHILSCCRRISQWKASLHLAALPPHHVGNIPLNTLQPTMCPPPNKNKPNKQTRNGFNLSAEWFSCNLGKHFF